MPEQRQATTLINTAVIVMGSYHLPASIAFGALVGASLFILSRTGYNAFSKAWLFAISYFSGIFGGSDSARILNWLLPDRIGLQVNDFTGAVLAAAFTVALVQYGYALLDRRIRREKAAEKEQK